MKVLSVQNQHALLLFLTTNKEFVLDSFGDSEQNSKSVNYNACPARIQFHTFGSSKLRIGDGRDAM